MRHGGELLPVAETWPARVQELEPGGKAPGQGLREGNTWGPPRQEPGPPSSGLRWPHCPHVWPAVRPGGWGSRVRRWHHWGAGPGGRHPCFPSLLKRRPACQAGTAWPLSPAGRGLAGQRVKALPGSSHLGYVRKAAVSVCPACHPRASHSGSLNTGCLLAPRSGGWGPRSRCGWGWSLLRSIGDIPFQPLSLAYRQPSSPCVFT